LKIILERAAPSKFLNFKAFKKIAFIMKNKEHKTIKGMEEILLLASEMNTKRSFEGAPRL